MKKTIHGGGKDNIKPARTGFRVVVHESISRFPVSNTKITFFPGGRSVTTKAKGMCFIEMEEGTYNYIVKAQGYPQAEGTAAVTTGVMKLLYIKMEKEEMKKGVRKSEG